MERGYIPVGEKKIVGQINSCSIYILRHNRKYIFLVLCYFGIIYCIYCYSNSESVHDNNYLIKQ